LARTPYYCALQEGDGAQYKFIDWIVTLPVDLEKKLVCEINESEEEKAMPIITNAEKIGIEKGKIETVSEAKIKSLAKKPTKKAA